MTDDLPDLSMTKMSRAENISEVVKEAIFAGHWKPGAKIDDQELAEKLDVSRLSVREALSKLVEAGIVERRHWKGYQLRNLRWDEVESILEVREALEEVAMRKVVHGRSESTLSELEAALKEADELKRNRRIVEFRKADYRFHEILYRASGNDLIADILGNLRILIELIRFISQSEDFDSVASASIGEHREILSKLSQGDGTMAIPAMRDHLRNHRERVRHRFDHRTAGSPDARTE